jgi:hypothetical protein
VVRTTVVVRILAYLYSYILFEMFAYPLSQASLASYWKYLVALTCNHFLSRSRWSPDFNDNGTSGHDQLWQKPKYLSILLIRITTHELLAWHACRTSPVESLVDERQREGAFLCLIFLFNMRQLSISALPDSEHFSLIR